jgi:hypothetical protein
MTPCHRNRSRSGAWKPEQVSATASGLVCIVRSAIAAHRATVTARSEPGGGLDISVVIPREPAAEPWR